MRSPFPGMDPYIEASGVWEDFHHNLITEIQPLVDIVYARSHYDRDVDYSRPLHPPLNPAEAAWLEERIRQRQTPT
jgi:hypothetical protein